MKKYKVQGVKRKPRLVQVDGGTVLPSSCPFCTFYYRLNLNDTWDQREATINMSFTVTKNSLCPVKKQARGSCLDGAAGIGQSRASGTTSVYEGHESVGVLGPGPVRKATRAVTRGEPRRASRPECLVRWCPPLDRSLLAMVDPCEKAFSLLPLLQLVLNI